MPCPLLLLDLTLGSCPCPFPSTTTSEVGRGRIPFLETSSILKCWSTQLFSSFSNHRFCRPSLCFLWEEHFFKHLTDFMGSHSIPHAYYHHQKFYPDIIFEPGDSHLYLTRPCALPSPLAHRLMVASLRASEMKGLDGETKQFITSC